MGQLCGTRVSCTRRLMQTPYQPVDEKFFPLKNCSCFEISLIILKNVHVYKNVQNIKNCPYFQMMFVFPKIVRNCKKCLRISKNLQQFNTVPIINFCSQNSINIQFFENVLEFLKMFALFKNCTHYQIFVSQNSINVCVLIKYSGISKCFLLKNVHVFILFFENLIKFPSFSRNYQIFKHCSFLKRIRISR